MRTVMMTLNASVPSEHYGETIDPLADFLNLEKLLGFARTGDVNDAWCTYAASLWQVQDYYVKSEDGVSTLTFEMGCELYTGRPALRPLFAVWTLALQPLLKVSASEFRISVYAYSVPNVTSDESDSNRPAFLVNTQPLPLCVNGSILSTEPEIQLTQSSHERPIPFTAHNSYGDSITGRAVEFTPIRVVEAIERLFPSIDDRSSPEFTITCKSGV